MRLAQRHGGWLCGKACPDDLHKLHSLLGRQLEDFGNVSVIHAA
jgi:hypothetical protein